MKINLGTGRDKITNTERISNGIVITFETNSGQTRPILVEQDILDDVKRIISDMEIGIPYKSKYIHLRYIKENGVISFIMEEKLEMLKKLLLKYGLNEIKTQNIIYDLKQNPEFMLTKWEENIGGRKKGSLYFKIYGAIRYWAEKGLVEYKSNGMVYRLE